MYDHKIPTEMEASFEEEQQETNSQLPDAPAATEQTAESFFEQDDDDDGFGDFEDAAWETAPEPASENPVVIQPPEQTAKVESSSKPAVPTTENKQDILSLDPAAFLDAATATIAPFSPLNRDISTSTITTLKDLKSKFAQQLPPPQQNGGVGGAILSSSASSWKGSTSQARLLHRLNLGPAPVVDSPLLLQPPPSRANLRPSSSGSLYSTSSGGATAPTAAASLPAPPLAVHRQVLAPPPLPLVQQKKNIDTTPAIAPPDPTTTAIPDTATTTAATDAEILNLPEAAAAAAAVDIIQPQTLSNDLQQLSLLGPIEQPSEHVDDEGEQHELTDKEEMEIEDGKEQEEGDFVVASSPPPPRALAPPLLEQQEQYQNPFLSPGEDEQAQELEIQENEDAFSAFEEAAPAPEAVDAVANADVVADAVEVDEWVDPFDEVVAAEEEEEVIVPVIEEEQHKQEPVQELEEEEEPTQQVETESDLTPLTNDPAVDTYEEENLQTSLPQNGHAQEEEVIVAVEKEENEDFSAAAEFEWTKAASPLGSEDLIVPSTVAAATDVAIVVDDFNIDAVLIVDSTVVDAPAPLGEEVVDEDLQVEEVEVVEEVEIMPEPVVDGNIILGNSEQTKDDDFDDFDDFCGAEAEEEKEEAVPTAAKVAEGLAATLPDLSYMLSDSLVKPNNV